uniref:Uncharacterized protein n=1 Tax=Spongospora subterranea TaxID=70186 RepID=A0A0H5R4V7_9EUKA|eukprot:CRZ09220.1 hypothetical protein [Spongospora subterranea]
MQFGADPVREVDLGYFDQARSSNWLWAIGSCLLAIQCFAIWGSVQTHASKNVKFSAVWYTFVQFAFIGYGIFVLRRYMKRFSFGGVTVGTAISSQFSLISALIFAENGNGAVLLCGCLAALFHAISFGMMAAFKNDFLKDKSNEVDDMPPRDIPVSNFGNEGL